MTKIQYLIGDATDPQGDGNKYIVQINNTLGLWGAGFVLAISKRWDAPERVYRALRTQDRILGNVLLVPVEHNITVVNMIAQEGCGCNAQGLPPIRYDALRECLIKVNQEAIDNNASIHAPRIGCGLAGGDWNIIEKIINEVISVDVFIYDLN